MAYPGQSTSTSTFGYGQQAAATGGLASPDLWANPRGAIAFRAYRPKNDSKSPPFTFDFHHATDPGKELPDELVRLYADLDNDSRNFLKYGPRSAAEKLAYAQQVNPLAHLDAVVAPQDVQQRFQDTGELEDTGRFFAGPDGRVYLRNEDSDEQLGAKIRRGYERAIGGFDEPTVKESLGNISEATRSKRADVELYNPPTLPEQVERERMLAPYHVNPTMWQKGDRAEDYVQEAFQESGYLWDAIAPWAYVGPDGVVYYKNELTRLDPYHAARNARDWWETQQYLKTLPEPEAGELLWRAMAAAGMLPGGRQVVFKDSSGKFVRPGSLEAGVQIRARLADIPRLAALYGWKQAPQPESGPQGRPATQQTSESVRDSASNRPAASRGQSGVPYSLPPISYTRNPMTVAEFEALPQSGSIDPNRIRTMQKGASALFKPEADQQERRSLVTMINQMRSNSQYAATVEPIRIFARDGKIWTLDHRRLIAAREAGVAVHFRKATVAEIEKDVGKWSTLDDGMSIRIRLNAK